MAEKFRDLDPLTPEQRLAEYRQLSDELPRHHWSGKRWQEASVRIADLRWALDEINKLRRIVNNVAVDLNEESYPPELRSDRAFSHLMECPEAVFGEFPHGPDAAAKAVSA